MCTCLSDCVLKCFIRIKLNAAIRRAGRVTGRVTRASDPDEWPGEWPWSVGHHSVLLHLKISRMRKGQPWLYFRFRVPRIAVAFPTTSYSAVARKEGQSGVTLDGRRFGHSCAVVYIASGSAACLSAMCLTGEVFAAAAAWRHARNGHCDFRFACQRRPLMRWFVGLPFSVAWPTNGRRGMWISTAWIEPACGLIHTLHGVVDDATSRWKDRRNSHRPWSLSGSLRRAVSYCVDPVVIGVARSMFSVRLIKPNQRPVQDDRTINERRAT